MTRAKGVANLVRKPGGVSTMAATFLPVTAERKSPACRVGWGV